MQWPTCLPHSTTGRALWNPTKRLDVTHLLSLPLSRAATSVPAVLCVTVSLAIATTNQALAASVVCHVDYGGETQHVVAPPVESPYSVKGVEVGSYFVFRVVNQTQPADIASVKVYIYANHDAGAAPIHQAQYIARQVAQRPPKGGHGFTGLHWVYEPVRDGELRYWCEKGRP